VLNSSKKRTEIFKINVLFALEKFLGMIERVIPDYSNRIIN